MTIQELSNPTPAIREMINEYDRSPQRVTVLTQQASRIEELSALITGTRSGYTAAKGAADQLAQEIGTTLGRGLVTEARELYQELAQRRAELADSQTQNADLLERLPRRTRASTS